MRDDDDKLDMALLRETFRAEAYELLGELENALLALEETPQDKDLVNRVFRAFHTIKGSGGACGFDVISRFTHEVETLYDSIRNGKATVTKEIIDLTLAAKDQIHALFDEHYQHKPADAGMTAEIVKKFKVLLPKGSEHAAVKQPSIVFPENTVSQKHTYRIQFYPSPDIFLTGANPLHLLDEVRALGPSKVVAQLNRIPDLDELNPELCYTHWDIILTTDRGIDAIKDVFIFVQDTSKLTIEAIDVDGSLIDEAEHKKLGSYLVERGDISQEDMKEVVSSLKRFGEILVDKGLVNTDKVEAALSAQQHVRTLRKERQNVEETASVRVHSYKLDKLVDLVGELVTVQARLSQTAAEGGNPLLLILAEEVERLTAELRDNTMSIRMLPIGITFSKFKRLVRDLTDKLGKEIELRTSGAETELDKTVIERLSDPLVHLIRNSIDHGIEAPEVREAAGKPRQGTIHLSAAHSGAYVLIRIKDDGAGLDVDAIRAKALEKNMIAPDTAFTDSELFALILEPDFSTAKKVTSVSGRGVGMDVVKKAIDALRGSIEIGSEKGVGTTITLKLPLTLAIIDGFLTRIGAEHFIFPLSSVEECIELTREAASTFNNRHLVNVRGHIVPYIRLREQFTMKDDAPVIEQVVIVREDNQRVGFVVDSVVGEHQTVLKSLGKFYQDVEGISGATILGDGTVALILDVPKLIKNAASAEQTVVKQGNKAIR
jgi:two-component system chemotaxis sensor kinase CheA